MVKSTILILIIGLYDNYCGNIYYNDVDIKSINTEITRKFIIYM